MALPSAAAAPPTGADVAAAAQLACLLEVCAPKPGNVSPGRHFANARFEDFLASAAAIGEPLSAAAARPLGETIRRAVEATARWTRSNTNLGIVLLLAPLSRAAQLDTGVGRPAPQRRLDDAIRDVLAATTVADARDVYAAIRLASPGGLGRAETQDVAGEPDVTLLEAMRLAAGRDGIAREYATSFETTLTLGVPALARARADGLSWDDAVVETFLTLLAASPDTHIARRAGAATAERASQLAAGALRLGSVRTASGRQALDAMDAALRDPRNLSNPGTTADVTAAAIFVFLLQQGLMPGTRHPLPNRGEP